MNMQKEDLRRISGDGWMDGFNITNGLMAQGQ